MAFFFNEIPQPCQALKDTLTIPLPGYMEYKTP